MPSQGVLHVDGQPIPTATAERSFQTPELEKGREYYYEVQAEVMRDGAPIRETRRVTVRAGEVVRTDFRSLGAAGGVAAATKP